MISTLFGDAPPLWQTWMPLIVVAIGSMLTVSLGAIAYRSQKNKDYQHELALHRRQVYTDYVAHIAKFRTLAIKQWFDSNEANLGFNDLLKYHAMLEVFADETVVSKSSLLVNSAQGLLSRCNAAHLGHPSPKQDAEKDAAFGTLSKDLIESFRLSIKQPGLK